MLKRFFLPVFIMLMLVVQACNLPAGGDSTGTGLALTITAQVRSLESGSGTHTPTPVVEEAGVVQSTEHPSGDVKVTVNTATNCRKGPGQGFDIVFSLPPGVTAQVVGRNSPANYWVIAVPGSNGETCWLWGQYAEVSGDASTVAEVDAPAAPNTPAANVPDPTATFTDTPVPFIAVTQPILVITKPSAPVLAYFGVQCVDRGGGSFLFKINMGWDDKSFNEAGFEVILTRPAGPPSKYTTTGTAIDVETVETAGTVVTLSLTAYNSAGHSAPISETFKCP